jgi:hypothetical protein
MGTIITKYYLEPNGIIRTVEPKDRFKEINDWYKYINEQVLKFKAK